MSIEAVSWALDVPTGGNAKVVLLGLANHAHPDGTEAFPTLDTLARYAHCDRSTARRNLRRLEDDGWISRTGIGPNGQAKWRLNLERECILPRLQNATLQNASGGTSASGGVAPVPPEPSFNRMGDESPIPPLVEPTRLDAAKRRRLLVHDLFVQWQERCNHPQAKLTARRRRNIDARLREGYTPEQIRLAIDKASEFAYVSAQGTRHDDVELICRSGEKLEDFIGRGTAEPAARPARLPEGHRATPEHQAQVAAFVAARAAEVNEDELAAFRAAMKGEPA